MNDYEIRRQEKIKKNQALLAELNLNPVIPKSRDDANGKPPAKKRKLLQEKTAPSRTSARIASAPTKASYNDDALETQSVPLPRSAPRKSALKNGKRQQPASLDDETDHLIPTKNIDETIAGWTAWEPTASPPTRDEHRVFHFAGHPTFTPNKSPEEVLREGSFGGSYWRPLKSHRLGITVQDDWSELPAAWTAGLNAERYLTNPLYDAEVNKYHVSCGQSIEEWEAAGWISHEHDVRGWFQWYCRFFQGRRCADDERQVGRWRKCVGETGRWRRTLLKRYLQMGVREVFDDGEEEGREVSPVVHQTCHHWAFEVRQEHLDAAWAGGGG